MTRNEIIASAPAGSTIRLTFRGLDAIETETYTVLGWETRGGVEIMKVRHDVYGHTAELTVVESIAHQRRITRRGPAVLGWEPVA